MRIRHALWLALVAPPASAQTAATLDTVRVTVSRDTARSPLSLPFAVTAVFPDSLRPGQRRLAIDEALAGIPGVAVANRQNPTQDPRISIRGFGARSAFGVRGVRVTWEGIPVTLPDGQTPLDFIDLEAVERVEIIRGSTSALYGNSAGGVVALRGADSDARTPPYVRFAKESPGISRAAVGGSAGSRRLSTSAHASLARGSGFRDYSYHRATRASSRVAMRAGASEIALHVAAFDMPVAQNPGALTAAQMSRDPASADSLSKARGAGKTVRQGQLAVSASRMRGPTSLSFVAFAGVRELENPLTFATVLLDRSSGGAGLRMDHATDALPFEPRFSAGIDLQTQNDDRHELENCRDVAPAVTSARCPVAGAPTGRMRRDQRELVLGAGPYMKSELSLTHHLKLTIGARADRIRFEVIDRMPAAQSLSQSGVRVMKSVSPMAGLLLRIRPLVSAYVNVSSSFETPTVTELANRPGGATGLNPDLEPQKTRMVEMGAKGLLAGASFDLAAYRGDVTGELIPFEIPGGAGRRFFRNAGRTRRVGLESAFSRALGPVDVAGAYTWSRSSFVDFDVGQASFAGNGIPGIPEHRADISFTRKMKAGFVTADVTASSDVFVDDANSGKAHGYLLAGIRGSRTVHVRTVTFTPVIGVQNAFDRRHASSVSVNAAGGKFFEPGPGRTVYVALRAGL